MAANRLVSSAENVAAVPLAAVFLKNPDTELVERFVYVQRGEILKSGM
jgi:hypothetical protein